MRLPHASISAWETPCRRRAEAGFTLIELVISGALMAMILTASYVCLNAALATQKEVEPRLEALQVARVTLALLTADLRAACPLSKEHEFIGMQRKLGDLETGNLDFGTHHYTPARSGEGDFCQVSYFVERNPESGETVLMRRRNPRIGVDPLAGGRREEIARGIRELKFEYYDGWEWYDTWGDSDERTEVKQANSFKTRSNLTGLPEAVRIRLAITTHPARPNAESAQPPSTTEEEPPLVFETVVRLNLAGASAASAETAEAPAAGGTPGNPGAPMVTPGGGF